MTEPGVFVWTSPFGDASLFDHTGSRAAGRAWAETGIQTDVGRCRADDPAADPPDL